jgi:hypothetical protein
MRFVIDIPEDILSLVESQMIICGFNDKKEYFDNALSFFNNVIMQSLRGYAICSINDSNEIQQLIVPALENIRQRSKSKNQENQI